MRKPFVPYYFFINAEKLNKIYVSVSGGKNLVSNAQDQKNTSATFFSGIYFSYFKHGLTNSILADRNICHPL